MEDLRHLSWSQAVGSINSDGAFLKATSADKSLYYKISAYNSSQGVYGHETINELIAYRVSEELGIYYGGDGNMRRVFAICDPAIDNKCVATLYYDMARQQFTIEIDRDADVKKLPLSLKMHAELGRYDLNEDFSMDWVRARVCPPSRHNISSILQEVGLSEYDEFGILVYSEGKSLMDDLFLVELTA